MEALQILKFIYKKERLDFSARLITPPEMDVAEHPSDDLLADLFTKNQADATDTLLHVCGADDSD